MKLKRMLACILTLLLVVSLLPISALAENNPEGETIETTTEDIGTNNGTIQNNNHTVETNAAVPNDNGEGYKAGTGYIETNNGIVNTNAKGGEIEANNGTVGKEDKNGIVDAQSGNYGTIDANGETGEVLINQEDGVIKKNFGTIDTNKGSVGRVVEYDPDTGSNGTYSQEGNYGTISTNEGIVTDNGGFTTIRDENGVVQPVELPGTIETNAENGVVLDNAYDSSINKNLGIVWSNYGTVTNEAGGEVKNNCGTVTNKEGGKLDEYSYEYFEETDEVKYQSNTITAAGTYYGIDIFGGYLREDENTEPAFQKYALLQRQQDDIVDLTALFTQDGYKVTGYYYFDYDEENEDNYRKEITSTTYTVNGPSYLELIWSKIKAAVFPSAPTNEPTAVAAEDVQNEPIPVRNANVPTAVAAEDVQVGTAVRVKGQIFKVIEMDDGSITVVTMVKLSKKDMEDLMEYLAKYLTPQQLELLLSDPELLSSELAAKFFGGNTNHIVFKAAKNLFAQ